MMAPAMTRSLIAPGQADAPQHTGRHGVPPPQRPAPPVPSARLPEPRIVRRIVAGVLVGGLVMLGVAALDSLAGAQVPVLAQLASLPGPADRSDEVVDVVAPPATPGTCLSWQRPDAADAVTVDCAAPHLFEQAGSVTLADQVTLPDDRTWGQLVKERCTPVVQQYLGGKYDPRGRYRIGALKPSAAKWEDGDRELRCGLQSASRSGALYPMTGKAADGDQSNVREAGTCLAIDGKTVGDPIDCAGPHAVETVGIVDLATKFPDKFPAGGDQDGYLLTECSRIAGEYAGGADVITKKKLTVYWDNLTEESWTAGSRKVNCNLAALLPDKSGFAPVTGSVKGEVAVGDQPAPPAQNTPGPGVPAQPRGVDGPPSDGAPPADADPSASPGGSGENPPSPTAEPIIPL